MALNCKFIIVVVLINVHVIKPQKPPSFNTQNLYEFKTEYPFYSTPRSVSDREPISPSQSRIFTVRESIPVKQINPVIFRFSNIGLQRINQDFISSDDIITLSLDNNEINNISPSAFRKMKNLRHLNLSGNKIPKNQFLLLYNHNNKLQTLIINNNADDSSDSLKEYQVLQNLQYLQLCSNQMPDIQVPFHLATPNLISLHLSNNSINSSINNIIFDNLPTTLIRLHLDRNLIDQVTPNKFSNLQELMMDHNLITQVCFEDCQEKSISLKGAIEMRRLNLSKNLIEEIVLDAFNDMPHLSHLDLSYNKISDISQGTFNNTKHMAKLSLANNTLVAVPDVCSMLYLRDLNLSGNRINAILSNAFCLLRHLEHIDLSNNIITTIHTRAFTELPALTYLDLSRNRLKQLPVRWISPWILEIHLEQNQFTKLDDISLTDVQSVKNIYLEENPMVTFEAMYFQSVPKHLKMHLKNVKIKDKCAYTCENDEEEEEDDDNDNDY